MRWKRLFLISGLRFAVLGFCLSPDVVAGLRGVQAGGLVAAAEQRPRRVPAFLCALCGTGVSPPGAQRVD